MPSPPASKRILARKLLKCSLIASLIIGPSGCGDAGQQLLIGASFVAFAAAAGAATNLVGDLLDQDPKPSPPPSAAPTPTPVPARTGPGRLEASFQILSPERKPLGNALVTLSFRGEEASATSGSDGFARITLDSRQPLDPKLPLNAYSADIHVRLTGYQELRTSKAVTILAKQLTEPALQSYTGILSGELQLSP